MSEIVLSLAVVIFASLWWRGRRRHSGELQTIAEWLEGSLKGEAPRGVQHKSSTEFLAVATQTAHVAERLQDLQRDQSAEAANLQTILASMSEGVLLVDARHVIRLANPSLQQMLELKASPVGRTILETVRAVSLDEVVSTTLATEQVQQAELSLSHIKPPRHLTLTATSMRDADGEPTVLVICHDVTRLKQLEEVRKEFVANVSHELRTPLSIFQGYLETMIDCPDMERADLLEHLAILQKHSNRLNALVEDLLVLARLESRTDSLCLEPIAPRQFLDQMVRDWKLNAGKKRIQLSASCAADAPDFHADPLRFEQVMNNLIENAIKYTEPGGAVALRASSCPEGIEIRVEDTGLGIPPQDLPHIFERFYRADKARSREHGGTGLGLSIVKHIMQKHGGAVRAESVYRQGTSVILTLPVCPETGESLAQPGREMQPGVNGYQHEPESQLID